MMQNLKLGANIEVKLNVSSKEYNGRYYHNISAWEITLQDEVVEEEVESEEMPF